MGFIVPGKRLKKRKYNKLDQLELSSHIGPVAAMSTPSDNYPVAPKCLQDLPLEVLFRIFILSKPQNNLPLVNKYFNRIFKFEPDYDGFDMSAISNWYNISLVIAMAKYWYISNLNTRLDFPSIERKLKYYQGLANAMVSQNSSHYRRLLENLSILKSTIDKFKQNSFAVDEQLLSNKFTSSSLIDLLSKPCFVNHYLGYSGELVICNDHMILMEIRYRWKFIRLKFKELAYHINKLNNSSTTTNDGDETETMLTEAMLRRVKETYNDHNERLLRYTDDTSFMESLPVNRIPFYYFDDNKLTYNFQLQSHYHDFPDVIYQYGIVSVQKLRLITSLYHFNYQFCFPDQLLINTFAKFAPRRLSKLDYLQISLNHIIKELFRLNDMDKYPISSSSIIEIFKLYKLYESLECGHLLNLENQTISEDISLALLQLLNQFYGHDSPNDRDIWKCVLELKSNNLAQALMKFSHSPDYDLLLQ